MGSLYVGDVVYVGVVASVLYVLYVLIPILPSSSIQHAMGYRGCSGTPSDTIYSILGLCVLILSTTGLYAGLWYVWYDGICMVWCPLAYIPMMGCGAPSSLSLITLHII